MLPRQKWDRIAFAVDLEADQRELVDVPGLRLQPGFRAAALVAAVRLLRQSDRDGSRESD